MARDLRGLLWVTAYTDASWRPGQSLGGWAFWLRTGAAPGRLIKSGPCGSSATDSNTAELCAIVQAVEWAVWQWARNGRKIGIGIRSDSQTAIVYAEYAARNGAAEKKSPAVRYLQARLHAALDGRHVVRCKWVKGHSKGDLASAYLNRKVDEMARAITGARGR